MSATYKQITCQRQAAIMGLHRLSSQNTIRQSFTRRIYQEFSSRIDFGNLHQQHYGGGHVSSCKISQPHEARKLLSCCLELKGECSSNRTADSSYGYAFAIVLSEKNDVKAKPFNEFWAKYVHICKNANIGTSKVDLQIVTYFCHLY